MSKELPRYTVEARASLFGEESTAACALREADARIEAGEAVAFLEVSGAIKVVPSPIESTGKRPSGFYRVKEDSKWTIAKYSARLDRWESVGEGGYCEDDSWEEIDPEQIPMPADDCQDK